MDYLQLDGLAVILVSGLEASPLIVMPLLPKSISTSNNFLLFLPITIKKAPSFKNAFTADLPIPDDPPPTIIFFYLTT